METPDKSPMPDFMPLHQYLHLRMKQLPDVTNLMVAEALGYPKPNVVAMIFNGSMKLPLAKIPDLARVLEIDSAALLRRTLAEYEPGVLVVIERTLSRSCTLSKHEMDFLDFVRNAFGHEDIPVVEENRVAEKLHDLLKKRRQSFRAELMACRRAKPEGAGS